MLKVHQASFVKFCIVGGINTLIDLAVFSLLFYALSVPLLAANTAGFCAGVLNSYLMNKAWTFGDRAPHTPKTFILFIGVALGGLGISSLTIWVLAGLVPVLLAKLAACGASMVWNYGLTRFVVFKT